MPTDCSIEDQAAVSTVVYVGSTLFWRSKAMTRTIEVTQTLEVSILMD
jgi:hypothetical protein